MAPQPAAMDFVINFKADINLTWGYVVEMESTADPEIKNLRVLRLDAKQRMGFFKWIAWKIFKVEPSWRDVERVPVYHKDELIVIPKGIYSPTQNLVLIVARGNDTFTAEAFVKTKFFQFLLQMDGRNKVMERIIREQQALLDRTISTLSAANMPQADLLIREIRSSIQQAQMRPVAAPEPNMSNLLYRKNATEQVLLGIAGGENVTAMKLYKHLNITYSHVAKITTHMKKVEWIERKKKGRQIFLILTKKGQEVADALAMYYKAAKHPDFRECL